MSASSGLPVNDVAIVGGGILGLATAYEIGRRWPDWRVTLFEKEPRLGQHQTSHNSGVLHSGIYYRPGSRRARWCLEGARRLRAFCAQEHLAHATPGKLIVATAPEEVPRLQQLHARGQANDVGPVDLLGPEALRDVEPEVRGLQALHVHATGVVDFAAVARRLAEKVRAQGGAIESGAAVARCVRHGARWRILTARGAWEAKYLVACAGLHADHVARRAGVGALPALVPFRGEYQELVPEKRGLVRGLVYPVPDPALPFLGVHLTRGLTGEVHVGPNAVMALKREGYRRGDISLAEMGRWLGAPGVWRMMARYWRAGAYELSRSFNKAVFVRSVQRLVPTIQAQDLVPGPSGVRAQLVLSNGTLADDFELVEQAGALHLLNAPSPAATASLAIGRILAEKLAAQSGLPGKVPPQEE